MAKLLNVEIKARTTRTRAIREILNGAGARFVGRDHQVDTYFHCVAGRLKLREGTIENALIFYRRPDDQGPRRSDVVLERLGARHGLKPLLSEALGVRVVVDKQREIFFIDNVKFHLDEVRGLGSFVEIEAIDEAGNLGESALRRQCEDYMALFGIDGLDLVSRSYSDMVLETGS